MTKDAVPVRFKSESATGTGPAILEVGGVDVAKLTRSVVIRSEVGELATVTLEVIGMSGLDVTLPAAVTFNVLPFEEGEIEETVLGDGMLRRFRFVKKSSA